MFGRLGKWWAAACAYEFLESALACRCGARAERDAAPLRVSRSASDSTNSSAFFLLASLRPPNLLDRKFGGELSVNAKGGKICVWGRLVGQGRAITIRVKWKLISSSKLALLAFDELQNVRGKREGWGNTNIV